MNTDDYNQITVEESVLDAPELMKEGELVSISINTEDGYAFVGRYACKCCVRGKPY